jgi:hypothetical protein
MQTAQAAGANMQGSRATGAGRPVASTSGIGAAAAASSSHTVLGTVQMLQHIKLRSCGSTGWSVAVQA